jgi:membrane protein
VLFSVYTANFGRYNETYGALGAIVVVILWLLLTTTVVILGAQINCELERQTVRDTTKGDERPLGQRNAYAADTVGPASDTA